jgi:hypothetical protein
VRLDLTKHNRNKRGAESVWGVLECGFHLAKEDNGALQRRGRVSVVLRGEACRLQQDGRLQSPSGGQKSAAKGREGVTRLEGCLFSESELERARLWLHQKDGEVAAGKQHAASTPPQAGEAGCVASEARYQKELEALTDEERYLLGLAAGERHGAVCKGDVCFCKQHLSLFGGIGLDRQPCEGRCCSPANSSATGKRPRAETENGSFVTGSAQRGVKRRSKTYWAAQPLLEATCDDVVDLGEGGPSACSAGGQGPDVIRVCGSCNCPSTACLHVEPARVAVVMLMGAEGIHVETPKLVRSTDGVAVHDPPVTLLKQPVRVSQLVARDFEELSKMAGLCAPCPRELPPCGTGWLSLMHTSHIYSLDWSQEVGASLSSLCRSSIFQSANRFYGFRVSSSSRSAVC